MNQRIRDRAKERGVYLWEIAQRLGCNDGNFSRRLRKELPESERERIFAIIEEIAKGRES